MEAMESCALNKSSARSLALLILFSGLFPASPRIHQTSESKDEAEAPEQR